jgi:hypothetical protein
VLTDRSRATARKLLDFKSFKARRRKSREYMAVPCPLPCPSQKNRGVPRHTIIQWFDLQLHQGVVGGGTYQNIIFFAENGVGTSGKKQRVKGVNV